MFPDWVKAYNKDIYIERRHIMSVSIKSAHEIELMREAGRILAIVHDEMAKIIRPGACAGKNKASDSPNL